MTWGNIGVSVAIALVFYVLGIITPPIIKRWSDRRRKRKDEKENERTRVDMNDLKEGRYRWGRFEVEGMVQLEPFVTRETSLGLDQLITHYVESEKALPSDIGNLVKGFQQKKKEDEGKGKKCHNDPTYSLEEFFVNRKTGVRKSELHLKFSPSVYAAFRTVNLELEAGKDNRLVKIRDKYGLVPENFDTTKLSEIPLHLRFGTNTVVVTSDDKIVLLERSKGQRIDSGREGVCAVHIVGEGMFGSDKIDGRPNPFATVIRGLEHELGIKPEVGHYCKSSIKFLALNFDFKRYQPIGLFTVHLNIDSENLERHWITEAQDHSEAVKIIYINNNVEEVRKLLDGEKQDDKGLSMVPVYTHPRLGLFQSLFYYHPFSEIEKAFAE